MSAAGEDALLDGDAATATAWGEAECPFPIDLDNRTSFVTSSRLRCAVEQRLHPADEAAARVSREVVARDGACLVEAAGAVQCARTETKRALVERRAGPVDVR